MESSPRHHVPQSDESDGAYISSVLQSTEGARGPRCSVVAAAARLGPARPGGQGVLSQMFFRVCESLLFMECLDV
jgi:hypothetical protein